MGNLIVHATNVHQAGGKRLLLPLLRNLKVDQLKEVHLDARLPLAGVSLPDEKIVSIWPSIRARLACEWQLSKNSKDEDTIFCFGSLPPLFRTKGRVIVYFHNRHILKNDQFKKLPIYVKFRVFLERIWFHRGKKNVNTFWVQTQSMKRELLKELGPEAQVEVRPLYDSLCEGIKKEKNRASPLFLYVATGNPHKNHLRLIQAWCELAKENIFPELTLTLCEKKDHEVLRFLQKKIELFKLKISNTGDVAFDAILNLYRSHDVLIYPSLFESFGLPLLEARDFDMDIIAAEKDYVREVINPSESFDPMSAYSIARAVKRYMRREGPFDKLIKAEDVGDLLTQK